MRKFLHTPAPWRLDNWRSPARLAGAPGSDDGLALIYLTNSKTRKRDAEHLANAALILAAPELLEALAAVVDWLDRDPETSPLGAKSGALAQSLAAGAFGQKARAALDKALTMTPDAAAALNKP